LIIAFKTPFLAESSTSSYRMEEDDDVLFESNTKVDILREPPKDDITLTDVLRVPKFWLLFFINMCLVGSGIMVVNNMVPIVISKMHIPSTDGYESPTIHFKPSLVHISSFVTIFAVCDSFGRTIFGGIAEYYLYRFPKSFFLIFPSILMSLTLFGVAVSNVELLYVVMVTLGLSLGGTTSLLPAILSEIFGNVHITSIQSILSISSIMGSIIFSQLLAGRLNHYFESQSIICLKTESQTICYCNGSDCYFYALISMGVLCLFITCLSYYLLRTMTSERQITGAPETEEFLGEPEYDD